MGGWLGEGGYCLVTGESIIQYRALGEVHGCMINIKVAWMSERFEVDFIFFHGRVDMFSSVYIVLFHSKDDNKTK